MISWASLRICRILTVQKLGPGHVNRSLVVWKHQSDKVDIVVAGLFHLSHGHVHLLHAAY